MVLEADFSCKRCLRAAVWRIVRHCVNDSPGDADPRDSKIYPASSAALERLLSEAVASDRNGSIAVSFSTALTWTLFRVKYSNLLTESAACCRWPHKMSLHRITKKCGFYQLLMVEVLRPITCRIIDIVKQPKHSWISLKICFIFNKS